MAAIRVQFPYELQRQQVKSNGNINERNETQDTNGQTSRNLLDMIFGMQKTGSTDEQKNTSLNDALYRFDKKPGESIEDALKRSQKPFEDGVYRMPNSGQGSGNTNGSSTAIINKAFNEHNRNAGLDKSKVIELASSSGDPVNSVDPTSHYRMDFNEWTSEQQKKSDPVGTYYIGSGDNIVKGNVYGISGEIRPTIDPDEVYKTDPRIEAMINAATSQVGYEITKDTDTKYGEWYNRIHPDINANDAWCNMFTSWAATQGGLGSIVPIGSYTPNTADRF